jgi:hypothetical protein
MVERKGAYRVFVGQPDGKRPLGRRRRRWEDDIRMDLKEIGWESVDRIDLAQNRDKWQVILKRVMYVRVS